MPARQLPKSFCVRPALYTKRPKIRILCHWKHRYLLGRFLESKTCLRVANSPTISLAKKSKLYAYQEAKSDASIYLKINELSGHFSESRPRPGQPHIWLSVRLDVGNSQFMAANSSKNLSRAFLRSRGRIKSYLITRARVRTFQSQHSFPSFTCPIPFGWKTPCYKMRGSTLRTLQSVQ